MTEVVDMPDSIRLVPATKSTWGFLADLIKQVVHYRFGLAMFHLDLRQVE